MARSSRKKSSRTSPRSSSDHYSRSPHSRLRVDFSETKARLIEALTPLIEEWNLYLEEVKVGRASSGMVVRLTLDLPEGPGGIDSDTLTEVSRAIAALLDDVDLLEGSYNLEVSTPGAERALTCLRHFSRAQGRLVAFHLTDGTAMTGRVRAVTEMGVDVELDGVIRTIAMGGIASARVQIEFGRNEGSEDPDGFKEPEDHKGSQNPEVPDNPDPAEGEDEE